MLNTNSPENREYQDGEIFNTFRLVYWHLFASGKLGKEDSKVANGWAVRVSPNNYLSTQNSRSNAEKVGHTGQLHFNGIKKERHRLITS